jgi:hypothetical protein
MKYLITEKQLKSIRKYLKNFINENEMLDTDNVDNKKEQLHNLLKGFDWSYEYAPDHREWKYGNEQMKKIMNLANSIGQEGRAIYNSYAKPHGREFAS